MITSLPWAEGRISINHLFFTDDSLLFCKENSMEWSSLFMLLDSHEKASRQRLNKDETSIFFSKNTQEATKEVIINIAGVRASPQPALLGA